MLASAGRKGWVKIWDGKTDVMLFPQLQAQKGFVRALAFSPDGQLLATGGEDNQVNVWDVRTRQRLHSFTTGPATTLVQALEFSPDGRRLAAADQGPNVRLWNLATGFYPGFAKYQERAGDRRIPVILCAPQDE
jgi:WD40 repeat protein